MNSPILLFSFLLVLGACEMGPWAPEVGPPQQAFCVDEDSDESVDVSFSADIVERIFREKTEQDSETFGCLKCHDPSGTTPIGFEVGGLDLTSPAALRAGGVISGSGIVIPGRPCESVLFQKISAGPPFGSRMPFDGPPFLDESSMALIHDWIAEGARDN